jgi:hypothetical protein
MKMTQLLFDQHLLLPSILRDDLPSIQLMAHRLLWHPTHKVPFHIEPALAQAVNLVNWRTAALIGNSANTPMFFIAIATQERFNDALLEIHFQRRHPIINLLLVTILLIILDRPLLLFKC